MAKQASNVSEIDILKINTGRTEIHIIGTMPLILQRLPEKAWRELLLPKGRKGAAERASSLKHDPYAEFRSAPYIDRDPNGPTLLQHLASAFKAAMCGAALDIPGATKSQLGRLTWVVGERISIYGVPQIFSTIVRSADMNHTPDVRTRVIVPRWAAKFDVAYVQPNLRVASVANLIAAAGLTQGLGDWRPQKGKGTYGQYAVTMPEDKAFLEILKTGGRAAQVAAMANPVAYDEDTEELLRWYMDEAKQRGFEPTAAGANGAGKKRGTAPTVEA